MKKMRILAVWLLSFVILTGCSSRGDGGLNPSPTIMIDSSQPKVPENPTDKGEQVEILLMVGEEAKITVGTTKIEGKAYYAGNNPELMLLPLLEVSKALGWSVHETSQAERQEIRLSREGTDEVTIVYERPEYDTATNVPLASVVKGSKTIDAKDLLTAYIDGMLYVPKALFDLALQEIDVLYDGATKITIEARA